MIDANISLRNIPKICHEADRLGGLPYKITHAPQERFPIEISIQDRKGLDFMKQTAIMLSKQASKQASKLNYVLNPVGWQPLLSRDAV